MSNAQTLSWLLTADDRASGAFKNVASSMSTMTDRANLARTALTALGATAAVGYLVAMTKRTVDLADSLDDLAQFTGISAHGLSTLKYAVDTTGPGFDVLTQGLQTMYKAAGNAAGGNLELVAAFGAVGVSLDDIKNKKPDELLLMISDGLAAMPASAQKADLSMKLFKGSAEQLVPWLNNGSAAIKDLRTEAEKAGLAISNEFAAKAGELNDNLGKLKTQANVLGIELGSTLVPIINNVATAMLEARQEGDGWFDSLVKGIDMAVKGGKVGQLKSEIDSLRKSISEANSTDMGFVGFYARNPDAIGQNTKEWMAAKQKELADKQAELAGLVNTPPPSASSGGGTPTPDAPAFYSPSTSSSSKSDPYLQARAGSDAALKGEQATYEARKELLRSYLDAGVMSYADYYSGLSATEDAYYVASRRKIEAELGRQRELAKTGDAPERAKALAKQTELLADLDVLEVKQHAARLARDAEQAKAKEALNTQLQQYYVQFLEQSGQEVKAAELKATAQFAEIERLARINGLSTEYIDKLKAMASATAKYDSAVKGLGLAQKRNDLDVLKAQGLVKSGAMSGYAFEKKMLELRKESARAMLAQAEAAVKLAEATGDADKILDAQGRVEEIRNTINEMDGMQQVFWESLEGHTQSALEGILNGTTSIMDGVKGVFSGVMQDINREMSKELASMVSQWIRETAKMAMTDSAGGAGGGWMGTAVSVISSLFGARAAGGSAGGLTLVGEHGPELANLPRGSHVYNNARTQQMMSKPTSAGLRVVFNVNTPDAASFRRSEGQIQTMLTAATRRGMRNA